MSAAWDLARAEEHLLSLELFGMRFGLERMRRLLTVLGSPQERFEAVHVVGTNGKSSTVRFTAALLEAHGVRTGAYLSPHLTSYAERIRVGDAEIGGRDFAAAIQRTAAAAAKVDRTSPEGDRVTQFELLTAAAFSELARREVEVAVVEAGLGGRWDATNVLGAPVVVLTNVGLEHTRWLGPTIADIAGEKLAVVRPTAPRSCSATNPRRSPRSPSARAPGSSGPRPRRAAARSRRLPASAQLRRRGAPPPRRVLGAAVRPRSPTPASRVSRAPAGRRPRPADDPRRRPQRGRHRGARRLRPRGHGRRLVNPRRQGRGGDAARVAAAPERRRLHARAQPAGASAGHAGRPREQGRGHLAQRSSRTPARPFGAPANSQVRTERCLRQEVIYLVAELLSAPGERRASAL